MKLVMAVIQDKDSAMLSDGLIEANFQATKLSSTGSFLRAGNTTFMIGVEDKRVDEVLAVIKENCQSRDEYIATPVSLDVTLESSIHYPIEVRVGGATVFVLPVDNFMRF